MMKQRQSLQDFLREEQEPFQLNSYVEDRRGYLQKHVQAEPKSKFKSDPSLRMQKRTQSSFAPANFTCNNCFLSYNKSPDSRNSPAAFLSIRSPVTRGSTNAVLLPAQPKVAALLLEAALKVYKPSSQKPGTTRIGRSGLFRPLLARLMARYNKVKQNLRLDSKRHQAPAPRNYLSEFTHPTERKKITFSSETSEGNILDELCLASAINDGEKEIKQIECDYGFCSDYLDTSCDSGIPARSSYFDDQTSELSTTVTSPTQNEVQDRKDRRETESPSRSQEQGEETVATKTGSEEDKEQCSPVSILDPPFGDDCDDDEGQNEEYDSSDLDDSYAMVQRKKKQILKKIRKFEKLAGLDPVELVSRMTDFDNEVDSDVSTTEDESEESKVSVSCAVEENVERYIVEELGMKKMRRDMYLLVSDMSEEEKERDLDCEDERVARKVCTRLESWGNVKDGAIDMMVGLDLKRENIWEKIGWLVEEVALGVEEDIVEQLINELSQDLSKVKC